MPLMQKPQAPTAVLAVWHLQHLNPISAVNGSYHHHTQVALSTFADVRYRCFVVLCCFSDLIDIAQVGRDGHSGARRGCL